MSTRELRRAEVLGRVKGQTLRLVDAAKMLELSFLYPEASCLHNLRFRVSCGSERSR
jgi:hypothetical protein